MNDFQLLLKRFIINLSNSENPTIILHERVIGRMGKRQVKSESALKEIRLPEGEEELFGRVLKILGGENVLVKCTDGVTRRGRIRGKLKRRVWIRDNDIVIIAPWDFKNNEMGDIVWRFTLPQVEWLKENGHIPRDF
jgi:translation initiation factor 1A